MPDKLTERTILLENLRICRCILEYKADENWIASCRLALKSNVAAYDKFMKQKEIAAVEREEARKKKARAKINAKYTLEKTD